MALPFALLLLALAWGLGALQLWPRMRRAAGVLPWLAGALGLAFATCLVVGIAGLARHGDWGSPAIGQVVHGLLGEGNVVMRRTGWAWLDRASNTYLQLDLAFTLLLLCLACLHGFGFWAGVAEQRRRARARRAAPSP
ncbi:MAG: hypothetical protein LCH70_14365 [Proteobacteria bacterium]|nr:hypothetical protein [Pseudomonadota bacterium]